LGAEYRFGAWKHRISNNCCFRRKSIAIISSIAAKKAYAAGLVKIVKIKEAKPEKNST